MRQKREPDSGIQLGRSTQKNRARPIELLRGAMLAAWRQTHIDPLERARGLRHMAQDECVCSALKKRELQGDPPVVCKRLSSKVHRGGGKALARAATWEIPALYR